MRGLTALDRRLAASSPARLAVAFSGGGDSLALLLLTKTWADAHGRRVLALTVDHGLQPASAAWTEDCRGIAARIGTDFRALRWEGPKPTRGLPAAARAARHRLLADAAREAGARVLLMGHTADDLLESAAMRDEGSTVPDPREWAPSPVWPEGRGVFVLRPLLAERRAALRDWLIAQGETWIDDPANEDARFARSRARAFLSSPAKRGRGTARSVVEGARLGAALELAPSTASRSPSPVQDGGGEDGVLTFPRETLDEAALAAACLCAAGTSRPPRGDRLARLMERLQTSEAFAATLGGARIEAAETVQIMRDAGESARGGLAPVPLQPNTPTVWDGRYELTASAPGLTVQALKGLATRLPDRATLKSIPAAARLALPAIVDQTGAVTCPILADHPHVRVRPLALERFLAATGRVQSEPA